MQPRSSYQPIENYGIIGDLNTIALVGLNGSIDFMCFPDFDSPSVFASLIDASKGGFFRISPKENGLKNKQLYLPDTNVLLTRFLGKGGIAEITDFMPVESMNVGKELVRTVSCVRGNIDINAECCPRFDYGRAAHTADQISDYQVTFHSKEGNIKLRLTSTVKVSLSDQDATASFKLKTGEKATFMLEYVEDDEKKEFDLNQFAHDSLYATINFWKDWINGNTYRGRWMETVNRSALVLKLMISQKYGSMVASPTFGLPEEVGGVRNWDYRYTWIRDASFTVYTLLKLGYKKEAREFIAWVEKRCNDIGEAGNLRLMYSLDGQKDLFETELKNLEGYKQSAPVRIGNGAYNQVQLDIYGELLDAVYLFDKHAEPISYDFWLNINVR
ncbi:glycoside hydrolase family 15 protein [Chryseolinea sp. T2]|uniref:glycoside hydrolase family 15 protein n=1 Tax=Chryseolinea sp. T2 TaxID=3129255 RepID=UPI003078A1E4